jgi:hypothetical protein
MNRTNRSFVFSGVRVGSEIDSGNQILRVCSREFIADDCCQIRNFRIYPAITRKFLQRRRSAALPGLLSSAATADAHHGEIMILSSLATRNGLQAELTISASSLKSILCIATSSTSDKVSSSM